MTDTDIQPVPEGKLYKYKFMYGVSFLGGPLAAGYIIAENFKTLGDRKKYRKTWLITILTTLVIFGIALFMPGAEHIPRYMIPFVYTMVAFGLMKQYQGQQIDEHIRLGGKTYSGWRAFLAALVSIIITLGVILPVAYISQPGSDIAVLNYKYGTGINEVSYNEDNITRPQVQAICEKLAKADFFDSSRGEPCYIDKPNGICQLNCGYRQPVWDDDTALVNYYIRLQAFATSPEQPLEINICDDNYNVKKVIR